jgi:hypothetical protein
MYLPETIEGRFILFMVSEVLFSHGEECVVELLTS